MYLAVCDCHRVDSVMSDMTNIAGGLSERIGADA